jgi:tight adherence protein B
VTSSVAVVVFFAVSCAALGARAMQRAKTRARLSPSVAGATRRAGARIDVRRAAIPVSLAVAGYLVLGVVGAVAGVEAALAARRLGARRSRRASAVLRDEQLADAVGALTSAIRAGLSVPQSLAYTAQEAEPPLRVDLESLVHDLGSGVPTRDAIVAWTERVDTDDARLLGSVLELHRRTGGDLPVVLDQVAATIRERVAAGREVRALTAQARLSGLILGLLPIGFFAFLWLTSRRDIEGALGTPAGMVCVGLGLAMEAGAFLWIRHLLEVA